MYMKIQMEREQQQEISRRAAEAAREAKWLALKKSHEEALARIEAKKAAYVKLRRERSAAYDAKIEAEKKAMADQEAKKKAAMAAELARMEEVNRLKREESAERAAKLAILGHPEYKKMSSKAQAFTQKLGNTCCEVLEKLNAGEEFRLKMEKECRLTC